MGTYWRIICGVWSTEVKEIPDALNSTLTNSVYGHILSKHFLFSVKINDEFTHEKLLKYTILILSTKLIE